jgi:hypothetical protein
MSQFPPGAPVVPNPMYPAPKRTNGMAIAGLVCAILGFCLWFVGGLLGIIFGLIGLGKSRDPQVGGRGIAIAAIFIGLLSLLASGGFTYLTVHGIRAGIASTKPPRDAARQFVQDLSQNDVAAATADATSDLSNAELQQMAQKLHGLGGFRDMTSSQMNMSDVNGSATYTLQGVATFASGTQNYDITVTRTGPGNWKVSKAQFP